MMMHPSYQELMKQINDYGEDQSNPVVRSRYSVVIATSKRARQITEGAEPYVTDDTGKALSIAVKEFREGKVKIVQEKENAGEPEDLIPGFAEEAAEETVEAAAE